MEFYKPLGRAIKYDLMKWWAEHRVDDHGQDLPSEGLPAMAFLVGCGRSGTTVLGDVFGRHPEVHYFYEPYHLWATIDPLTDVTNRYQVRPAHLLMDGNDVSSVGSTTSMA